ncbi:hypothetical protein CBER1_11591 [Cercospora berteroae]|uniref:Uncharacterized protein n=1 Tax=Cercospora berteroae TaxID=357750 RepID=A0A2S6CM81_9PEZI|nr:hypothetical protein CBER1_11591 [Cercospora berteroae]
MTKDLNDYQPVPDYSKAGPFWVQAAYERDRLQKRFDAHQEHLQKKQALQMRRDQFLRDAWEKRTGQKLGRKDAEDAGEGEGASRRALMAGEVRVKMENENENETAQAVQEERPRQCRGQKRAREEEEEARDGASNVGLPQTSRRNGPSALPPYPGPKPISSNDAGSNLSTLRQQQHNGVLGAAVLPPPPMRAPLHVPPSHYTALRTTANPHQQSSSSRLHTSLPGPNASHHPFSPGVKDGQR